MTDWIPTGHTEENTESCPECGTNLPCFCNPDQISTSIWTVWYEDESLLSDAQGGWPWDSTTGTKNQTSSTLTQDSIVASCLGWIPRERSGIDS